MLSALYVFRVCISIESFYRYIKLSPSQLISRLTARNLHLLALRISSYLNLPPSTVLKHWAYAKILRSRPTSTSTEAGVDDQTVCDAVVEKFEKLGGAEVSYAEIAKKAWEVGRTELATKAS